MARRFVVAVVLAWVVFLGLLAALISGGLDDKTVGFRLSAGQRQKKDVVVIWLGELLGGPSEIAGRKIIDDYNRAHKDVYIRAVVMPYACYLGKVNVAIATGQPPDVCVNAVRTIDQLRVKQKVPDLAVPIPEDLMPDAVKRRYGPSCVAGVSRRGTVYLFPTQKYLFGGMLRGHRRYFEKAGINIDYYVEHGWDYRTFREALKKVQAEARRERGPEAYGFGLQPAQMTTLLYQNLLPNVVGKDATERDMLYYDKARRRYRLDPAVTPEKLAMPLELMQQLMNVDKTWTRKSLGMDFSQQGHDCDDLGIAAVIWSDTPGSYAQAQMGQIDRMKKGLRKEPIFRMTNVPCPTPRTGMPIVFRGGADGYGVMKQIPYKGDKHTRHALEFAKYITSPPVLAKVMVAMYSRANPKPDEEAVFKYAKGFKDPIRQDPGLSLQWDLYLKWLSSPDIVRPNLMWPDQDTRDRISGEVEMYKEGAGHRVVEDVVYNKKKPLDAAKEILANIKLIIDGYYRQHPR